MHAEFWQERWRRHEIGFHLSEVNPCLLRHWHALQAAPGATVMVPLCGKSLDMAWLAGQGHPVTGVELSERAVREFFAENDLSFSTREDGAHQCHEEEGIRLLQGNFMAVTPGQVRDCQLFYDRAALIALPSDMRRSYVEQITHLLPGDATGLLVTLDYDQARMDGPPFAVSPDEVRELYGTHWQIELLEECDILAENPRFIARGLNRLHERAYCLRRR